MKKMIEARMTRVLLVYVSVWSSQDHASKKGDCAEGD